MNWRISKAAAVLFLSSFLFSSCEDPTAIGLELQEPGTQIGTTYSDTSTVVASTVLLQDSIIGLGAPNVQVGRVTDGEFGTVTAKTFAEFGPLSFPAHPDSIDVTKGADSLIINLDYSYSFGDTTKTQTFNVHRLTQGFRDDETYYTSEAMSYNDTPVGTVTFLPRPRSTTPSATDATVKVPVLLKLKITGNFANEVLQTLAQTSTLDAFTNVMKGLAIIPADGSAGEGSVIGFSLMSSSSTLTLHYKSKKNIAKTTTFLYTDRYYNQVRADRTGTPLASFTPTSANGSTLSSTATNNRTYLQAGTGLATVIRMPHLAFFRESDPVAAALTGKKQDRQLAINKAELIIPVVESSVISAQDSAKLPPVISVVTATPSNRMALTQGTQGIPIALTAEGTSQRATLQYRGKQGGYVYVINITSYIQNLLYNRLANNGLILLPSNLSDDAATPTNLAQTVNRAIIEANQSNNAARRIKLRLFYSTAQ
ncbi:DUF4270 family protein [Rufibacter immobilis]|uniref:DUF4270 family protein n=1 Tax=Rufibacter immobilis TaxID=1348778 RepID=UPI00366CF8F6